jgi:hypothetical protein
VTATYPSRSGLRECRLYRFWVLHPLTGEEVLGYIGETGRQPFERLLEHLATQPWFDTVVRWEVDGAVFYGKAAVEAAEAEAIRAELPLYNYEHNLDNPLRIEVWRAKEQRRNRDRQQGRALWAPKDTRTKAAPSGPRTPVRRRWKPWQKALFGWSMGWLASFVAAWITLVWRTDFPVVWHGARAAAIIAGASCLLAWLGFTRRGRRVRRAVRRFFR